MITLLSDIIDTDIEAELLAFLLLAPPRTFSLKELSVRLEHSVQTIATAAEALEKQNVIKEMEKGEVRFYSINQRNAMLPDIRSELLKVQKPWEDELFSSLKKLGQLSGIFLSGIFVAQPQLPVDVLLVGKINLGKLEEFLNVLSKLMGAEINYSVMSEEEFSMRKDTFDRFLKDIFDYPHITVIDTVGKGSAKSKPKKKK